MLHYFSWKVKKIKADCFLINPSFWIQVAYAGEQTKGDFFLYPYLDENKKSVFYFAFDTSEQKETFEKMLKVSGVGPKIAFQIVQIPYEELAQAIEQLDTKVFQTISGIGPKLAKKIILELKGSFNLSQAVGLDKNQKNFKAVVKSMNHLGYNAQHVKEILLTYPGHLEEVDLAEVIKWVIKQL